MILYRFFFEWLGEEKNYYISTKSWWDCWQETFNILNNFEKKQLLEIIHQNKFSSKSTIENSKFNSLLNFYIDYKNDVVTEGTELFYLKKEYDSSPTRKIRKNEFIYFYK